MSGKASTLRSTATTSSDASTREKSYSTLTITPQYDPRSRTAFKDQYSVAREDNISAKSIAAGHMLSTAMDRFWKELTITLDVVRVRRRLDMYDLEEEERYSPESKRAEYQEWSNTVENAARNVAARSGAGYIRVVVAEQAGDASVSVPGSDRSKNARCFTVLLPASTERSEDYVCPIQEANENIGWSRPISEFESSRLDKINDQIKLQREEWQEIRSTLTQPLSEEETFGLSKATDFDLRAEVACESDDMSDREKKGLGIGKTRFGKHHFS